MRSAPAPLIALLALCALPGGALADDFHALRFISADGSPMEVVRVGNGFLLTQDGLLSKAEIGPAIVYRDPEGKLWTARWDLGEGMKINEKVAPSGWRSSDSFSFVDREGKAWQGARVGDEYVLKPLPALTPEIHTDCVEFVLPEDHHYRSCCAPNRMNIAVFESDDKTIRYVKEFSYLDWNNAPYIAAWKGDRFLVRVAGGEPAETASLEVLGLDRMRQTAAWDAAAAQFKVSLP